MDGYYDEVEVEKKINKIRVLMGEKQYSKAIRNGLILYNDSTWSLISIKNKDIIAYNLALSYKKINSIKEAIFFLNISLNLTDQEESGYYQILWLINNCEIELGVDEKENILNRFNLCLNYYKMLKDREMIAHILYNISKYKQMKQSMYRAFKLIVLEKDSILTKFISYDKRSEILSILEDFEELDINLYKRANNYLDMRLLTIDSMC